jgi:predicted unusual protein kinase regulating ubiquinone biosynthesis (AarF/ABC1/UbiB family)
MAMNLSFFKRGFENMRLFTQLVRARKSQNRELAQSLLAQRMGTLHGLPQKLGQTLSMLQEIPTHFDSLQSQAQAMPFAQVEACLNEHWGTPWQQLLRELDENPNAASLGQVHRGLDLSSRELAIKIAYPGIRQAVLQDLQMLGWLGQSGGLFMGFDWGGIRDLILADLEEELDYRIEARNQTQYREQLPDNLPIVVPEVIVPLSREQVLATVWEPGHSLSETLSWPEKTRRKLGQLLVSHGLYMLFHKGLLHTDPHPGNYRFRDVPEPTLVLYDFGAVARFEKRERLLLLKLIRDTMQGRDYDPLETMAALGFNPDLLQPIRQKLPAICHVLFEPFLIPAAYDLSDWQRSTKINHILGDQRWNFRFAGPPRIMFLVRMFQGLLYYLQQWQVNLAWKPLIEEILRDLDSELDNLKIEPIPGEHISFQSIASQLYIKLTQKGITKVKLTFPLNAIDRLGDIMGPDIASRVAEAGIDVDEIVKNARASGLQPQTLFNWKDSQEKAVIVWLE